MSRSATLALAVVLLVGLARAQPHDVAKADALFREGRALMKKGDYESACPKLEESYRLDPAAGTGINLGDCFERQGKVASALLAYQAARALLLPGDPRIGPVEKEIAALDKRAPRLTIKLAPGAPEGTTVKRDGREVGASKLGVAVPVNPGRYKITVTAVERDTAIFRVSVVEGKNRELEVGPGEQNASVPASSDRSATLGSTRAGAPEPAPDGSTQRMVGLAAGGVAIAGLAVGVGFSLAAAKNKDDADALDLPDNACVTKPPHGDCAKYQRDLADRERNKDFALGGFVAGGIGVLGLVAVLVLWPDEPAPRDALRPTLHVGARGQSLMLHGRF